MVYKLQILHGSDFEAGIPALNDAVGFSTVVNALRDDVPNTLTLSSGDNYIPGPFFSSGSDGSLRSVLGREGVGRADIAILNAIGIQASALGNHEFDQGTGAIDGLLTPDRGYAGARFPYLSANLNFTNDSTLGDNVVPDGQDFTTVTADDRAGKIAKSTVLTVGGERIGIVGATTPTLARISSPGSGVAITPASFGNVPSAAELDALAAEIQPAVNALTATGINKIVLLTHMQQLDIERDLAKRLRDVDVLIAGGSHTLLADEGDRLRPGDTRPDGLTYPLIETSPTGPVAVLNTAANYRYVGRFVADFDDAGQLIPTSLDPAINGAYATDAASVQALTATNPGQPSPEVTTITSALRNLINGKDSNLFGFAPVYLEGNRNAVRTEETNLGNLTADANLAAARRVDPTTVISIKNGGGIRDAIGTVAGGGGQVGGQLERLPVPANPAANKQAGQISQLDIENSLRFNNTLSLVTVTAAQLKEILEHGLAGSGPGRTPGQFPQVGGVAFSFDVTRPVNDRVRSIALRDENDHITDFVVRDGQVVGDAARPFRVVTLNFLAGDATQEAGGDNYPFPRFARENPALYNQVNLVPEDTTATFDTEGSEQRALANYLRDLGTFNGPETPIAEDRRIQNLAARTDEVLRANFFALGSQNDNYVLVPGAIAGTGGLIGMNGNDTLTGTAGDDFLAGNRGADVLFGGEGGDRLFGGRGNDAVFGGNGNDLLAGDFGTDTLTGGAGSDTFVLRRNAPGQAPDVVTDFSPVEGDRLTTVGFSASDLVITQQGANTQLNLGDGTAIAILNNVTASAIVPSVFVTNVL
jgi:5'-nucleotidase/UDP-sugar diphosphatase